MPTADAAQLDRAFHALADESRRAMVVRLSRGAASVSELAAPLDMALPSVMQHLDVLQRSGLVRSEKVGRVRTCRLESGPMRTLEQWIAEHRAIWEGHFDRLAGEGGHGDRVGGDLHDLVLAELDRLAGVLDEGGHVGGDEVLALADPDHQRGVAAGGHHGVRTLPVHGHQGERPVQPPAHRPHRRVQRYAGAHLLAQQLGPSATVAREGDGLRVERTVEVSGVTVPLTATGSVALDGDTLVVDVDEVTSAGVDVPGFLTDQVSDALDLRYGIPELPFGLQVTGVTVGDDGVRIAVAATDTVLSA